MKRLLSVLAAALATGLLLGCAQARADVDARLSIDADAGATAGLSSSPTAILQDLSDGGSGGVASVGYGWPVTVFPGTTGLDCPSTGCADRSAGATASVDEAAGILRAGAAASVLVGNAPDPSYGGLAFVTSEASVDDTLTLSKAATVTLRGTVHGTLAGMNGDPNELQDPTVDTAVQVGFCCRRLGESFGLIGGYDESFSPDAADGSTTPVDETFSIPVDLPAGDTEFKADLQQQVQMLADGLPGAVLAEDGRADFTGTVTFDVVVPDDVVATSSSGLLPIVGGAQPVPSDTTPPVSTATVDPAPNAAGWNDGPVTVHVAATDEQGGSGVASVTVATSGAQDAPGTTTAGGSVDVPVAAEGATTVTYFATDADGNQEAPKTVTVRIDRTPPSVVYTGNAGTYTVDQQVAIACHADDALSGVASSTCHDVTGPAYSFALGVNTFGATATDTAGNTGHGQTSFTVVVDPQGLARLTVGFVTGSPAYQRLSPREQALVARLADVATRAVARIAPSLRPAQKAAFLRGYDAALAHLVRGGWLTSGQAATLAQLAGTL
jgi:hypothetical protein